MKKKRMWHLIDYQRELLWKYDRIIKSNDTHMKIQDNALIRKDQEIEICNNAAKALKETLEETQEALSRSRNFVRIIQSDKRRSIKDMAKDLYGLYYWEVQKQPLDIETEWWLDQWMWIMIEILSWEKIIRR